MPLNFLLEDHLSAKRILFKTGPSHVCGTKVIRSLPGSFGVLFCFLCIAEMDAINYFDWEESSHCVQATGPVS